MSPLREAARPVPIPGPDPDRPALEHLRLRDFRNYATLELELAPGPVVLFGPNGAGKTNLLEAISLLAPGRGLRRARLEALDRDGAAAPFRLDAGLRTPDGPIDVASGREAESDRRWIEIAGQQEGAEPWFTNVAFAMLSEAEDRPPALPARRPKATLDWVAGVRTWSQ